jgi:hypothetical protein
MRRLKAGWVMCRSSAAREKFPLAARARKSSSQDRFIDMGHEGGRCFQSIKDKKMSIGAAASWQRS